MYAQRTQRMMAHNQCDKSQHSIGLTKMIELILELWEEWNQCENTKCSFIVRSIKATQSNVSYQNNKKKIYKETHTILYVTIERVLLTDNHIRTHGIHSNMHQYHWHTHTHVPTYTHAYAHMNTHTPNHTCLFRLWLLFFSSYSCSFAFEMWSANSFSID